jgi:hypothetical protein
MLSTSDLGLGVYHDLSVLTYAEPGGEFARTRRWWRMRHSSDPRAQQASGVVVHRDAGQDIPTASWGPVCFVTYVPGLNRRIRLTTFPVVQRAKSGTGAVLGHRCSEIEHRGAFAKKSISKPFEAPMSALRAIESDKNLGCIKSAR